MIEKDLTRIAVALEIIADALAKREEEMENAIAAFNEKLKKQEPEEVKETPVTHDTIGTGLTVEVLNEKPLEIRIPETPAPELKFEEVSKEFFALLNTIKASKGLDEAKQVATDLIRQYNNGKPISLATLPKESYVPLFEKITAAKAEYEPA